MKAFQPGPMVSFQIPRNLSSYLVRGKFNPMEREIRFYKYKGSKCQVCLNVYEKERFISRKPIALTIMINVSYIFWHIRPVLSRMLVVPQAVLDIIRVINSRKYV